MGLAGWCVTAAPPLNTPGAPPRAHAPSLPRAAAAGQSGGCPRAPRLWRPKQPSRCPPRFGDARPAQARAAALRPCVGPLSAPRRRALLVFLITACRGQQAAREAGREEHVMAREEEVRLEALLGRQQKLLTASPALRPNHFHAACAAGLPRREPRRQGPSPPAQLPCEAWMRAELPRAPGNRRQACTRFSTPARQGPRPSLPPLSPLQELFHGQPGEAAPQHGMTREQRELMEQHMRGGGGGAPAAGAHGEQREPAEVRQPPKRGRQPCSDLVLQPHCRPLLHIPGPPSIRRPRRSRRRAPQHWASGRRAG